MKIVIIAILLLFTLLVAVEQGHAEVALYEAEIDSLAMVKDDPDALGGQYVMDKREFRPVFRKKISKPNASAKIWVRYRGTALQLKSINADGKREEKAWIWDKPTEWQWKTFGPYEPDELGENFEIIVGKGAEGNAGLDAVVVSEDEGFAPDSVGDWDSIQKL